MSTYLVGKSLLLQVEASRSGERSALRGSRQGRGPSSESPLHDERNNYRLKRRRNKGEGGGIGNPTRATAGEHDKEEEGKRKKRKGLKEKKMKLKSVWNFPACFCRSFEESPGTSRARVIVSPVRYITHCSVCIILAFMYRTEEKAIIIMKAQC